MRKSSALQARPQARHSQKLQLDRRLIGAALFGAIPALLLILVHYQSI